MDGPGWEDRKLSSSIGGSGGDDADGHIWVTLQLIVVFFSFSFSQHSVPFPRFPLWPGSDTQ